MNGQGKVGGQMSQVHGTYHGGRVDLDRSVDWPDGSRVTVLPSREEFGLNEADWPDTPENRAAIVARLEAIEPLELTAEDASEIEAARQEVREITLKAVRTKMGRNP